MAGTEQRQKIIDDGAQAAKVAFHVGERGRADGDDDVAGPGGVGRPVAQLQALGGPDAIEQCLGARLLERHPAGAQRLEHRRVVIDAENVQTAVGEAQGERQPDPAQPDD